jgi:catechol 2,3-dioxygenase-like lactoylglutathione lyase family enzyme
MPPTHEIAHLAHVELRTPALAESLEFFTSYLGLTETGSAGDSVFLAGARLVLAPDWQPVDWTEAERAKGQAWGLKTQTGHHFDDTRRYVDALGLPPAARDQVYERNARRVYPRLGPGPGGST